MEVKQIIDRMAAIKKEQSALDDEYSSSVSYTHLTLPTKA